MARIRRVNEPYTYADRIKDLALMREIFLSMPKDSPAPNKPNRPRVKDTIEVEKRLGIISGEPISLVAVAKKVPTKVDLRDIILSYRDYPSKQLIIKVKSTKKNPEFSKSFKDYNKKMALYENRLDKWQAEHNKFVIWLHKYYAARYTVKRIMDRFNEGDHGDLYNSLIGRGNDSEKIDDWDNFCSVCWALCPTDLQQILLQDDPEGDDIDGIIADRERYSEYLKETIVDISATDEEF